jgi:hypothetical protein
LLAIGARHLGSARRDEDGVERRRLGPAERAVAVPDGDVVEAKIT